MKLHIKVDGKTKQVHSAVATAANVRDFQVLNDLLLGTEIPGWVDLAYAGQKSRMKEVAPRVRVEHVFHVLQCQFGFTKVRYRGLEQNANHLFAALALVNLVMAKR